MATIQFNANIRMSSDSKIVLGQTAWAPNLLVEGRYYPGRILSALKLLGPGDEGTVTLGMLVRDGDESVVKSGTQLELRDGPSIKVADATAI